MLFRSLQRGVITFLSVVWRRRRDGLGLVPHARSYRVCMSLTNLLLLASFSIILSQIWLGWRWRDAISFAAAVPFCFVQIVSPFSPSITRRRRHKAVEWQHRHSMLVREVSGSLSYKKVRWDTPQRQSLSCVVQQETGERDWVLDF